MTIGSFIIISRSSIFMITSLTPSNCLISSCFISFLSCLGFIGIIFLTYARIGAGGGIRTRAALRHRILSPAPLARLGHPRSQKVIEVGFKNIIPPPLQSPQSLPTHALAF
ncbi:110aa long hypothetical protein [Pyrococcus horikoshii OT3]|uniref:Uncharacterized protein n=1 Tax=Pyrococcus horikoshii (strain ATCC 700860 / DSM 12428 / JCM 9974 / NBRC 100139 / OT-3) TaxID=70601 RepID=O59194_PYRHO|nr:110aa long hypothetical protein [Pyrococcus horikoshii OT3]